MMIRRKEHGSVLIAVVVVLSLTTMAGLGLTLMLQDYARSETRQRDEMKAFYAAEAGALEIASWFEGVARVVTGQFTTTFIIENEPYIADRIRLALTEPSEVSGGVLNIARRRPDLLPVLKNASGDEVARVHPVLALTLWPTPAQIAQTPGAPTSGNLMAIVRSDGVTSKGGHKTVYLFLTPFVATAPGPIISHGNAAIYGNVRAHWGEVWAPQDCRVPSLSQTPTQTEDRWLKFKSEKRILFPDNWNVPKWGAPYSEVPVIDAVSGLPITLWTVNGTDQPCAGVTHGSGVGGIGGSHGDMMWQNQTLDWPQYADHGRYEEFKRLARSKGRYYSTDAAGNVYRDGIEDADHLVTDLLELNVPGDRSDWAFVDPDIIFVDTVDGNPPTTDGANLANLVLSGSGVSWKGVYYLCANVDISGLGRPSKIPITDPDGNSQNEEIFMDGILMVAGSFTGTGNQEVYGSVFAEGGFVGGGTPDVYYNASLVSGMASFTSWITMQWNSKR